MGLSRLMGPRRLMCPSRRKRTSQRMKVLGLTGSIGMGKSTACRVLRRLGVAVHDADAAVHRALGPGGAAVPAIAEVWPAVLRDGSPKGGPACKAAIDRSKLGTLVFNDPAALRRLEAILHPLVRRSSEAFLARQRRQGRRLVALDIPLLFETGAERRCDAVAVVTAPAWLQEQRVLSRPGMTAARLAAIRAQQMPDAQKRRRAHYVVHTGLGKRYGLRQLLKIVRAMTAPDSASGDPGCGKSCSTPKPPAWTRRRAIG